MLTHSFCLLLPCFWQTTLVLYFQPSIVVRKSRYDLGKSFFTNITPGYQLYPAVFLMNWIDPAKPGKQAAESSTATCVIFLHLYMAAAGRQLHPVVEELVEPATAGTIVLAAMPVDNVM